ncbi:anaerobic ribonucleoside-triphosphate reductase activating protein [Cerasicoccus fimbriatus]|uniref:anaerobic ribonucleoside-triphosphate reductase activating protein n=1 Tax=Cerasicoccus fimbriatus TaxID=3014554 RepID=UPI0022B3A213|nr:anaerobic ribonucleoside-triphosphate reductase activating protein [Cerasicoccus sp. TK19100]
MNIGGILKNSLLDFPGRPAVVVFTQGCNWRCPYCHNPKLIPLCDANKLCGAESHVTSNEVIELLERRPPAARNIVVTGGEPTRQPQLIQFLQACRRRGYGIKLDTNGSNPCILKELLNAELVDYVAMDVKGTLGHYERYCGRRTLPLALATSITLLRKASIDYEFRTTVVPALHKPKDFDAIGQWLAGGKQLFLQPFRATSEILRPKLANSGTPSAMFMEACATAASQWLPTQIRN